MSAGTAGLALGGAARAGNPLPLYTGPEASKFWSAVGPFVSYPQKVPLIMLTDRPVQLETPRAFFTTPITPNAAFYVRWHLDGHPPEVNLAKWRMRVDGAVDKSLSLSLADLQKLPSTSVVAVNQCSGNSRSRLQPRVQGSQWGNGGMGCALWTGVRLREILHRAGVRKGALFVKFQGSERGKGPPDKAAFIFSKVLDITNPILDEIVLAYAMNGEPLPILNGFPLRAVVPGYFATYWVKALEAISLLDKPDESYWTKTAYKIPDTPRGSVKPEDVKAGHITKVPIGRMPVRSFIVTPEDGTRLPMGLEVTLQGLAFSGYDAVKRVELSFDGGISWVATKLGTDVGKYGFRMWTLAWRPTTQGEVTVAVRATDAAGNVQLDSPIWNPGGYAWNSIERQTFRIGPSE